MNDFSSLPGADLLDKGPEDLRAGRESPEALLVAIGEPRLVRLGIDLPAHQLDQPEHRLYHLLACDAAGAVTRRLSTRSASR